MAKIFTKVDFANSVIALANGEIALTPELKANIIAKAEALLDTEANRKAYAETHKTSKAKGASEKTKALVDLIKPLLSAKPITSAEIAKALGQPDLSALNIANAVKYIEGIAKTKVVRTTTNSKGLKADKEYTAYYLA